MLIRKTSTQRGSAMVHATQQRTFTGSSPGATTSRIMASLAELSRSHPYARKLLVAPDNIHGRELLLALARATGGWIGWEVTTVRGLADRLAFVRLSESGKRIANDIEVAALANRALQSCVDNGRVSGGFADLALTPGFRRALRNTLLALRAAGIGVNELRNVVTPGSPAHDLPVVLQEYEQLLETEHLADPAAVIAVALEEFDNERDVVLGCVVALCPGLHARGLAGRLLHRLRDDGATALGADAPMGLPVPAYMLPAGSPPGTSTSPLAWVGSPDFPDAGDAARIDTNLAWVDMFSAVTPSEELREICRRVIAEGLAWDQVEIACTDPDTYGIALDALSQQVDFGASMLRGIPLARTRVGRAVGRWFAWLSEGLPADMLREGVEAGEVCPPGEPSAMAMAVGRELRALRIGWGRERYEAAVARIESGRIAGHARHDDEGEEDYAGRMKVQAAVRAQLARLLRALLAATPSVPARGSMGEVRTSPARLARATLSFLDLVPTDEHPPIEAHAHVPANDNAGGHTENYAEAQAMQRLRDQLERIAAIDSPDEAFAAALAALRDSLSELRAWPVSKGGRLARRSTGGMLHLTDLAHAGTTGRRRVFVAGLDSGRIGGAGRQDPLLPDSVRNLLGASRIATSAERRDEHIYLEAMALASLRGRVTLSYSTSGSLDGREQGPSHLLLQALRLLRNDPSISYDTLRGELLPSACAIPEPRVGDGATPTALIDARDVWLAALSDGALLLDAGNVLRAAFPMLAAGLRAREAADASEAGACHGIVPAAGAVLDPVTGSGRAHSSSSLEKLAACPLAWFYHYGLAIAKPDDPEYDAGRWLDPKQRGSLLHELFEAFTREYSDRQDAIAHADADVRMQEIATSTIQRWRDVVPPPGEVVFEAEVLELRRAARAFLQMERAQLGTGEGGRWLHFELEFGRGDSAAGLILPGGRTIAARGRADRVDRLEDGTLRVVDYKTGKAGRFGKSAKNGAFRGGRQLQPAVYAAAVEAITGEPVSRVEYRFPTDAGGNEIIGYSASELVPAGAIIASLLEHVHAGEFIPTDDKSDCTYCDHAPICRAEGNKGAPRAQWAKERGEMLDVYTGMRARRGRAEPDDTGSDS